VIKDGTIYLPFNPSQIVDNLYREVYVGDWRHGASPIMATITRSFWTARQPEGQYQHVEKRHLMNSFHRRQFIPIIFL
jgi:hypothetical protein